jgi:hypothetical protein
MPVVNYVESREDMSESGGLAPRILNIGTGWRSVISFVILPLYPKGRAPSGLIGSGNYGEENHLLSLLGIEHRFGGCPAGIIVTILTELLLYQMQLLAATC